MRERELFLEARAITDPGEREQFLAAACGDDSALRQRIEVLLEADQRDDSFLATDDTETLAGDSVPERPGERIGVYKLIEQIGEGGFGVVFMAEQTEPIRRMVALKVIKPGMDSRQVIARFEAERQALAIMDHPHIAKVLDAGTTPSGRPYFVMELVKGVPITQYCDTHRATLDERIRLFSAVCQAIQHAHSKGIIHRDIKPSNVLVAKYDDAPVVKVIDFGVAKATGGQLTELTLHTGFGTVVGSLEYMSPEQASLNQLDVDTRSDVYSLGVLLFELLTGSPPLSLAELRQAGMMESLRLVREQEAISPSTRLSTADGLPSLAANRGMEPARLTHLVRGDLDWIVLKALEKDRNRRYETVNNLHDELHRYLRGEPVQAHPPSPLYRLRKWSKRHWPQLAVACLAIAILVILGIYQLERHAQRESETRFHSARVAEALNDAAQALGLAQSSAIGQQAPWVAARASAARLSELLTLGPIDRETKLAAEQFETEFRQQNADRQLAEQIENVVIMSATQSDLKSWQRMETQFQELFLQEGIDPYQLDPASVAEKIRQHRSYEQLCDALELWIGTKGHISSLGGQQATRASMQPLADALLEADKDPVRTGIRQLIYTAQPFTVDKVDAVVRGVDLSTLTPRTLSWLASVYLMAKAAEQADRVYYLAVDTYPDDFMLNFDFAFALEGQRRWPEAIRFFLRCTALRPDVAGVWRGLGNAYRDNGELDRAAEALQRAASLAAAHSPTYVDLARIRLETDQFQAAEAASRRALELKSPNPMAAFLLAQALYEQRRFAEALVALDQCDEMGLQNTRLQIDTQPLREDCQRALGAKAEPQESNR